MYLSNLFAAKSRGGTFINGLKISRVSWGFWEKRFDKNIGASPGENAKTEKTRF